MQSTRESGSELSKNAQLKKIALIIHVFMLLRLQKGSELKMWNFFMLSMVDVLDVLHAGALELSDAARGKMSQFTNRFWLVLSQNY